MRSYEFIARLGRDGRMRVIRQRVPSDPYRVYQCIIDGKTFWTSKRTSRAICFAGAGYFCGHWEFGSSFGIDHIVDELDEGLFWIFEDTRDLTKSTS